VLENWVLFSNRIEDIVKEGFINLDIIGNKILPELILFLDLKLS